jgi:YVTN family beta-propeller protein
MLYVVVNGNNTVSAINFITQAIVANVRVGSNPLAIAVNANSGLVYVANDSSNTVTIINPATSFSTKTVTIGTQPQSIAVNPINGKATLPSITYFIDDIKFPVEGSIVSADGSLPTVTGMVAFLNGSITVSVSLQPKHPIALT